MADADEEVRGKDDVDHTYGHMSPHPMTRRAISPNHVELNDLRSRHRDLSRRVASLRRENERLAERHRATLEAIDGFESTGDRQLSQVVKQHNSDVQLMTNELREQDERIAEVDSRLRLKEAEVQKLRDELRKNRSLIDSNKLPDKDELANRFVQKTNELVILNDKTEELKQRIDNKRRSQLSSLRDEQLRNKQIQQQVDALRSQIETLEKDSKNTERDFEHSRIYTQRLRLLQLMSPTAAAGPPSSRSSPSLIFDDPPLGPSTSYRKTSRLARINGGPPRRDDWARILREQEKEEERVRRERLEKELQRVDEEERRRQLHHATLPPPAPEIIKDSEDMRGVEEHAEQLVMRGSQNDVGRKTEVEDRGATIGGSSVGKDVAERTGSFANQQTNPAPDERLSSGLGLGDAVRKTKNDIDPRDSDDWR